MHPCICWMVLCCVVNVIIISDNYFQAAFGCLEKEKIGLINLNNTIHFSSWGNHEDCCSWQGVSCNPVSKRIIFLDINLNFLQCTSSFNLSVLLRPFEELQNLTLYANVDFDEPLRHPNLQVLKVLNYMRPVFSHVPFIGELPSLKFLDLSGNNFNVFKELTNSNSLELLNLEHNNFEGQIPTSILALTSLKMLGLSNNYLNGSIPEGFCALTNLEELDLSRNEFEGVIPTCFSNFTSLRLLDLSNNNFSGSIPSNIFPRLKSLEYLSLSHNHFDGLFSFGSFVDHSKLEVFKLESDNPNLKVETENAQGKPPVVLFQLKIFVLSNCILNEPTGIIPSFLLSQYDLRVVDLSSNGISGELPSWLLNNNSRLEFLILRDNSFTAQLVLKFDAYNAYLKRIDISMNQVAGEIPTFIGSIFPNLIVFNMSTNAIEGGIPSSIGNMTQLHSLDISNNHLSGELLGDLFNGCEELNLLMLSNNNFGGNLNEFLSNVFRYLSLEVLYLGNNNFSGDVHLKNLRLARGCPISYLDISNNSITGRFPDWIAELAELETLVLSKNHFHGKLPTILCKLIFIRVLDLSWNNFNDTLPPCTSLSMLQILHLEGNGFHGPLPTSLSSSSTIITLDVRYNKFSGLIPAWISSLSNLSVILLEGNHFHGSIPSELCHMKYLRILDFSANNLSGYVPPCFSRIHFGKKTDIPNLGHVMERGLPILYKFGYSYKNVLQVGLDLSHGDGDSYMALDVRDEVQIITKTLFESYTGNILYSMIAIDLSRNRLIGPIPIHICTWENVHSLNLSYNHFNGSIPMTLSSLVNIESLDLSHNMLSGKIPSLVTELNFLTVFSVAYNNLSGPTPTRTNQFGTFDSSSYEGNPLLCGLPLNTSCIPTKMMHAIPFVEPQQNDSYFKTSFLWSFFGSFVVSCIGAFVFFYFCTNIPQIVLQWIRVEGIHHRRTVELPWKLINR